jgi:hypothetical protein
LRIEDRTGKATTRDLRFRDVYQEPRMVRGTSGGVTAVHHGDTDEFVLLRRGADGAVVVTPMLAAPRSAYLHEAVVVAFAG